MWRPLSHGAVELTPRGSYPLCPLLPPNPPPLSLFDSPPSPHPKTALEARASEMLGRIAEERAESAALRERHLGCMVAEQRTLQVILEQEAKEGATVEELGEQQWEADMLAAPESAGEGRVGASSALAMRDLTNPRRLSATTSKRLPDESTAAKRLRFLQRLFSVAAADATVVDMMRFKVRGRRRALRDPPTTSPPPPGPPPSSPVLPPPYSLPPSQALELRSYYDVISFLQQGLSERASEALRKKCSYPFSTAKHPIARLTLWRLDRERDRSQVELMLSVGASDEAAAEARSVRMGTGGLVRTGEPGKGLRKESKAKDGAAGAGAGAASPKPTMK